MDPAGTCDTELIVAAGALLALAGLALAIGESPSIKTMDRSVRRLARSSAGRRVDVALAPLFPLGLPGLYIPIAHAAALWLGARGSRSRRLPATAWSAWLAHRAVKLVYHRERPRGRSRDGKRKPRRTDSYPSGHTTGITALSLALMAALERSGRHAPHASHGKRSCGAVVLLGAAPLVMGTQRILADDHWASDVLGGLALGTAVACACDAAARWLDARAGA